MALGKLRVEPLVDAPGESSDHPAPTAADHRLFTILGDLRVGGVVRVHLRVRVARACQMTEAIRSAVS